MTDLVELLDQRQRSRKAALLVYREAAAELVILERFDDRRRYAYGDYGGGQRYAELSRRRNEVADRRRRARLDWPETALGEPTTRELREAFGRVALPKYRRLKRAAAEQAKWTNTRRRTRPTGESIRAWELVACELNLRIDNPPRRDVVTKSDPVPDR